MGKLSRTKGHSFERLVAQWFQDAGWPDARRQLEYHVKDALGVDLQETSPFLVQCKRGRTYAPITAIEEIVPHVTIPAENVPRVLERGYVWAMPKIPLLVTKADNKPAMVALPAEDFFKLIRLAYQKDGVR
jgi:hypothetical protein